MAEVDTSISPGASGPAAALAEAHSADHSLKLYGAWFCPFVQRAWIVLEEKHIPYQYIEVNPYHKSPEFLALNPRGLVPTLSVAQGDGDGGSTPKPLYESTVLCEYLDEAFADIESHGPPLLPRDAYKRARCRIWIDHISNKIIPGFYKLLQHTLEKPYSIEQACAELHSHIKALVCEMAPEDPEAPWFLGRDFSLVDISLAPWAMRLWLIDHYKPGGVGIPKEGAAATGAGGDGDGDGDDQAVWRRWNLWFNHLVKRRSVCDTLSDRADYITVYKRYADDTTNSLVAQATRKGEKLP